MLAKPRRVRFVHADHAKQCQSEVLLTVLTRLLVREFASVAPDREALSLSLRRRHKAAAILHLTHVVALSRIDIRIHRQRTCKVRAVVYEHSSERVCPDRVDPSRLCCRVRPPRWHGEVDVGEQTLRWEVLRHE